MALPQSALSELLEAFRAGEGVDLIRDSVRVALQELIELEATERIGAAPYERTEDRTNERNGHRPRTLTTKAGDVELRIPKLRKGSFMPVILEPRRRIDQALYAVVMEAYVHGVSTRSVDDLVEAMGGTGISKSQVSRICAGLDGDRRGVSATRTLARMEFPYVYLDATYLHVRNAPGKGGQVVSMAVVVATAMTADGKGILGLDVGDSEDENLLAGVPAQPKSTRPGRSAAVISDQHSRLVKALAPGVPRRRARTLPSALRPQPARRRPEGPGPTTSPQRSGRSSPSRPADDVHTAWDKTQTSRCRLPQPGPLSGRREGRGPGLHHLPARALAQDLVDQPLERVNKEIKRHRVVGIFPNAAAVIRLVGAVLIDIDDEGSPATGATYSEASMAKLYDTSSAILSRSPPSRATTGGHENSLEAHHPRGSVGI